MWPSRDDATLAALQDQADRHRRSDLFDPVAVARQYAATAMPGTANRRPAGPTVTGTFVPTGPTTGDVRITGGGWSVSTVHLRRLRRPADVSRQAAEQSLWYVQGVSTPDLAVLDVDYDGQRLVASFVPTSDGTLTVAVTSLDGSVVKEEVTSARAGHLVGVEVAAVGQPGLVVSATLVLADGSIAPREFRVGAPPP